MPKEVRGRKPIIKKRTRSNYVAESIFNRKRNLNAFID